MHLKVFCRNIEDNRLLKNDSELDVYYGLSDNYADMIPDFYNYLSDNEKARANRFKHKSDFNCYTAAHALLRIKLSKELKTTAKSILISETENGKPFASGVDLPFNLSRSKSMFAFAIGRSNQAVGIDIEQIKSSIDIKSISRNYFSISEQQSIFSFEKVTDQNCRFFEFWTRKEALLKAIGIGINTELKKVQVMEGDNQIDIDGIQPEADSYVISTFMNNNALISFASSNDYLPDFKDLS